MKITQLDSQNRQAFCELFKDYYKELDCDEDTDHLLKEYVLADCEAGLISIAVAGEEPCGFVIYQMDCIENDWCLKEGLGTVRELYVAPSFRGQGTGKALLEYAEGQLKSDGAVRAYVLPSEGAQTFFIRAGYAEEDEYCAETDCNFFYKDLV